MRGLALAAVVLTAGCSGDGGAKEDAVETTTGGPDVAEVVDADVFDGVDGSDGSDGDGQATDGAEVRETTEEIRDAIDADGGDVGDVAEPPLRGFPAAGLLVRIADPGANGTTEVTGSSLRVAGMLFGEADTLIWQSGNGSGVIEPGPFWQSGQIIVTPGDNRITVTAVRGAASVSDSLVVTYNPGFRFDDALAVRPLHWWVGEPAEAVFTISASLFRNFDRTSVKLLRVDAQGELVAEVGPLRDDGRISVSGDEIEEDGVYSWSGTFACDAAGPTYFRASARVNASPAYTAVSQVVRVDCLTRTTQAACHSHESLLAAAGAALEGGTDLASVVAQLKADLSVKAAGPAEDGAPAVWVEFDDGLLGAALAPLAGTRGGGAAMVREAADMAAHVVVSAPVRTIGARRALVLSPFASELGDSDESGEVARFIDDVACPPYDVEQGEALADADADIARFRTFSRYGVVALATHGAVLFGGTDGRLAAERLGWAYAGPQEIVWTGSPVACDAILETQVACAVTSADPTGGCPQGTRCVVTKGTSSDTGAVGEGECADDTQADLITGRAILTNRGLAVTPSFFTAWRGRGLPATWVHLGACNTMWNGTLASALYAAGADAITGFSGTVTSAFAKDAALGVFERIGDAGTLGDFHTEARDPIYADTIFRLFGATNLSFDQAGLTNADFEAGSTVGWTTVGDGRVVAQFGDATAVDGKWMGLVSSGLGYSVERGRLSQEFCIPEGTTGLTVWWRFYSEEFREWCGDEEFQDSFSATLTDGSGFQVPVVKVAVDDLCHYDDGTCAECAAPVACDPACFARDGCQLSSDGQTCTDSFVCQCGRYFEGLSESDIAFDKGGVYRTQWRQTRADVSALAGRGAVRLVFAVEDSGDSAFDTAILIDGIAFE